MQLSKNTISFFLNIFVFISVPPAFVFFHNMLHYHFFHFITAFIQNPDFGVSCNYMA